MSIESLHRIPAPAKLNLFLYVTEKRADGYHELITCFCMIDWCDYLSFERSNSNQITRLDTAKQSFAAEQLPLDDLCVRAALALQNYAKVKQGAIIHLEKNIPMQAGMGGGSSNAATTLLALNQLWGLHLSQKELIKIGKTIGADVAFFLFGQSALAHGIGEQLIAHNLPQALLRVVHPGVGVSTKEVFARCQPKSKNLSAIISGFTQCADPWNYGDNDLQQTAMTLSAEILQGLQQLSLLGSAKMTGSGSAVFVKLQPSHSTQVNAQTIADSMPQHWRTRDCNSLNIHPASWLLPT